MKAHMQAGIMKMKVPLKQLRVIEQEKPKASKVPKVIRGWGSFRGRPASKVKAQTQGHTWLGTSPASSAPNWFGELASAGIQVSAKNYTVVLTGQVTSKEARQKAEDLARRVEGVTEVENKIEVVPAP